MRLTLFILFHLIVSDCYSQNFELKYAVYGLGSSYGEPPSNRIQLKDLKLEYTYLFDTDSIKHIYKEDTIYFQKDTSKVIEIDQTDLDSISILFVGLENTEISYSNMCIRSGACYEMKVKFETGCTRIVMYNNYDSTVFRVINIINRYLPEQLKIYIPEDQWASARNCSPFDMDLTVGRKREYNCSKWSD